MKFSGGTKMRARLICVALFAWAATTTAALAHHSFAMFDMTKQVTLQGTIKTFKWVNPHSWIEINVPGADGKVTMWGVELTSPNNLIRLGWKRISLKPGDKVTMVVRPLRDGGPGGSLVSVTLVDGTKLHQ